MSLQDELRRNNDGQILFFSYSDYLFFFFARECLSGTMPQPHSESTVKMYLPEANPLLSAVWPARYRSRNAVIRPCAFTSII